jgi:hypothetical protein
LRIGEQIIAWGRADGINPTDNLTPRDFVVLLPPEEDQRFGTTAIKLDTYLSQELTFTAFASSFFEPAKFPLPTEGVGIQRTQPAHTANAQNVATFNTIPGMTTRVSKLWFNDTLQAEIFAVANVVRGDHFVRPLITYTVSDRVKVLLGANVYCGARDAQYGALGRNSGVFAEVRYGL